LSFIEEMDVEGGGEGREDEVGEDERVGGGVELAEEDRRVLAPTLARIAGALLVVAGVATLRATA
jgi:hypothetical protein